MGRHTPFDEQKRLVEAWRQSAQSLPSFASSHGLSVSTLRNWIVQHGPPPSELGKTQAFLEVVAVPVPPSPLFSVQVAGQSLTFQPPPPPDWFAPLQKLTC